MHHRSTKRSEECRRSARITVETEITPGRFAFAVCCPTMPAAAGNGLHVHYRSGVWRRRHYRCTSGRIPCFTLVLRFLSLIAPARCGPSDSSYIYRYTSLQQAERHPVSESAAHMCEGAGRAAVRSQTEIRHPNTSPCRGCSSTRPRERVAASCRAAGYLHTGMRVHHQ